MFRFRSPIYWREPLRPQPPIIRVETRFISRLAPAVFQDLVRRAGGTTLVTSQTTDLQAGFQLGVQHALNVVQQGFVDETPVPVSS